MVHLIDRDIMAINVFVSVALPVKQLFSDKISKTPSRASLKSNENSLSNGKFLTASRI